MRLIFVVSTFIALCCTGNKKPVSDGKKTAISLVQADSLRVLTDDSTIKVFADYNLNSRFHDDQKKRFNYWYYDMVYYTQRITAQNKNTKRGKLTVPNVLKGVWVPVYALDSTFYVQFDCDAQQRFSINDSTFNFFDGMMVVEPYVMDKIKTRATEFEIATRTNTIVMTRVDEKRTIYKVALVALGGERCFYVTPFSDFNKFPILVVEGKIGAVSLEEGVKMDTVYCEMIE